MQSSFPLIIADCGSTKSEWMLIDGSARHNFVVSGINPVLSDTDDIIRVLQTEVIPKMDFAGTAGLVYYGSGIRDENKADFVRLLQSQFSLNRAEVYNDILGAARALCGHSKGIACILGTGSNSCVYDGTQIIHSFHSPGYFFGDEGGGANLGRLLMNDFLRGKLKTELHDALVEETGVTREQVMNHVYRKPYPNRYLAGFSRFIHSHLHDEYMREVVKQNFISFIEDQLQTHPDYHRYPLHFTGSIAWAFSNILRDVLMLYGLEPVRIEKTPMPGLLEFHLPETKFV
jgi:glucosamine kinase